MISNYILDTKVSHIGIDDQGELGKVIACRRFGAKPLPETMITYYQLDHKTQTSAKFESKYKTFHS